MKRVSLSSLAVVTAGQSAPKSEEFSNSGIPFVRAGSLDGLLSGMRETSLELIAPDIAKKRRLKIYPKGSILFAKSGMSATKDRIYVLQDNAYVVSHLAVLVPNENVSCAYMKHALKQFPPSSLIKDPAYPAISLGEIENFLIPIPEKYADQKRIAHLLDTVDGLISERKRHLQQLDALLQSVFMEMFGVDIQNISNSHSKLSDIAYVSSGVTKGKKYKTNDIDEVPYLRVANVQDGYFNLSEIKTIAVSEKDAQSYLLHKGDLLLTEGGDPDKLGRGAVWQNQIQPCIYQNHIFCVRLKNNKKFNITYLSALVGSMYGKKYFLRSAKQTTGIASINSAQLKAFPVPCPSFGRQNQFSSIVEKVEDIKQHYQHSLTQLENLYGVLSQKAFKGELDLSRVPMPVEVVESISYDNTPQTQGIDLETIANLGYTAAQYVHKAAQAIVPLLAPLVAAVYGFQVGLRDVQGTPVAPQPALELSVHGKLPTVSENKARGTTEAKHELHAIFITFIKELGSIPFSAQDFLDALSQELEDAIEDVEQAQRITPLLYEEVKSWIFDSLEKGTLQQVFDDEKDNAIYLHAGEQL